MKYKHLMLLFPIGLSFACSATTGSDAQSENPAHNTPNGSKPQPSKGGEVQIQGSSLFQGAGSSGAGEPLGAEIPPSTGHDCVPVGISITNPGDGPAEVRCFFDEADDDTLAATLERRLEIINDARWVHLRLTFNPAFVDNSYGETAIGWGGDTDEADEPPAPAAPPGPDGKEPKPKKPKKPKGGHTFKDLVGSDHAEFQLFDANGELAVQFKLDYIEPTDATPSGYASAGVTGGDGKMIVGEADWILGATSSLDRNLNGCGLGDYTVDSPATDEFYTPNPDAPAWDFRVVYEVWVAEEAFGDSGFGDARIEYVHASPSKQKDATMVVVPGECPELPPVETPDAAVPPPETTEPEEPETTEPEPSSPDAGTDPVIPPPQVLR